MQENFRQVVGWRSTEQVGSRSTWCPLGSADLLRFLLPLLKSAAFPAKPAHLPQNLKPGKTGKGDTSAKSRLRNIYVTVPWRSANRKSNTEKNGEDFELLQF